MAVEEIILAKPRGGPISGAGKGILKFIKKKPLGALGGASLLLIVFAAIFAPVLATHDPNQQMGADVRLLPPGGMFWFGSDEFARDIYSRVIYGARISLYVGIVSVSVGTFIGTFLGVASGYLGGMFDLIVQRFVDTLLGFPSLILAILLMAVLGASLNNVAIAIMIGFIPRLTRVSRSSSLSVKENDYVLAAQALGATSMRILVRHVIPNCLAPIIVLSTGFLGSAIVAEAGLSFLGLGVPPPHPAWGRMLQNAARTYQEAAPWMTIFPGAALSLAVFGFNLFGDALRDVWDPRLRGT
jgi:peptide/nickel transport system permease protein